MKYEHRIPLKLVQGCVGSFAFDITAHIQTQLNRISYLRSFVVCHVSRGFSVEFRNLFY